MTATNGHPRVCVCVECQRERSRNLATAPRIVAPATRVVPRLDEPGVAALVRQESGGAETYLVSESYKAPCPGCRARMSHDLYARYAEPLSSQATYTAVCQKCHHWRALS